MLANAGHVTNEMVDDFQGGMQLQLGEGAGDQNRTVVAIKSVTSENLGRVTKGGYWEDGSAVYSDKTFTMKDVFGGGMASLKQRPTLAMEIIEQAIGDVSELRAQIGAVQTNMLQTNSNNLAVTMEDGVRHPRRRHGGRDDGVHQAAGAPERRDEHDVPGQPGQPERPPAPEVSPEGNAAKSGIGTVKPAGSERGRPVFLME